MKKILIVDDEADFGFFLKANLQRLGHYEVVVETDPRKSLQVASDYQPDLILLDIMMPGLSGTEVAEQLQGDSRTQKIPIVFLTAIATEEEIERRKADGAGQYMVAKPVQIDQLVRVIETVVT